ncbi:sulfotransferase family 2 domain-containing protein [Donghicola mangrovi]|uniref:Sulfotransferase family 2 domain-containing protein n=1 Tax=Donghicola mangrovi TaxID=2729614 RepID=A0A850Q1N9_9RHOB|nr:sulfotransferase family 2 domain-containing protein [Donghicola mangrovi]NVO22996.1 sulfotransferase family 2 domain-containing protein [Donghicola mangrovi]
MARKAPFNERISRRFQIAKGRTLRTIPGMKPLHKSVFFHMPKCGGTSVSEAMYATVPFNERIGVIDAVSTRVAAGILNFDIAERNRCHEDLDFGQMTFDLREKLFLQHLSWDTMLVHGHLFWSDKAHLHYGEDYRYVTLLRDPLERMTSNFFMAQRAGLVGNDVEKYLASNIARRHSQVYLRYLSGCNDIQEQDISRCTSIAKERISHFCLVGYLEDLWDFKKRYKNIFGVTLSMGNLNSAPKTKSVFKNTHLDLMKKMCKADYEIFNFSKSLNK